MINVEEIEIFSYESASGKSPFEQWLEKLDQKMRDIVRARIARVRSGNFGDCKRLKNADGIWELRIRVGPGYRIYFGKLFDVIVILLCAGDKGSQFKDIERAKQYWVDFQCENTQGLEDEKSKKLQRELNRVS